MKQIISSLDLGSNNIKMIVGEMHEDRLFVLAQVEVKSKGIKEGLICDEEKAYNSLKEAFKKIENILHTKINKVVLGLPSFSCGFTKGEGTITFDEEKEVNGSDITKVLQSSVAHNVNASSELVSVMPIDFIIDDKTSIKDPKGKMASKLSVNSVLTTVPKDNVDVLYDMLDKLGVKIVDLAFNVVADYYEYRNKDMINKSVAVIDIGENKTEVAVIKDDVLIGCETTINGGKNIDRDISYIYDISLEDSRKLKENFALCHKSKASTSEIADVTSKNGENLKINQYEISEVVYSRVREILESAKKSINLLTKQEISYIIIVGGTSMIDGFMKVYSEVFGSTKVLIGIKELGARNNKFGTALGLIKLYSDKLNFRDRKASTITTEEQKMLFKTKKKNDSGFFGKVYNYFFDN